MRPRFLEYLALASLACLTAGAAIACGGISDPNHTASNETTATITGKLTGSAIPSGARVALVWKTKTPNTVIVGADVPVTGNTFTMTLTQPAEIAFFSEEDQQNASTFDDPTAPSTGASGGASGGSDGNAVPEPAPAPPKPSPLPAKIRPLDTATGTVVTDPFTVALAGFVLYADANGNGKLDVDANPSLTTPDTILGGSHDLALAFLRGGGQLAYEKLRDKAGQLPTPGFNLMWAQKERWLPMTAIELSLGSKILLPSAVCNGQDVTVTATARPAQVVCSGDGRSYHYESSDCVPSPPVPPGLCSSGYQTDACGGSASSETTLPDGPVPAWWPCPVATADVDGGSADAGKPAVDAGAP